MEDVDPLEGREQTEQQVSEARLLESLDRDGELQQLATLLQNEALRDFLWRVLVKCGLYAESFNANFGVTGYNLGRASVGRWILSEICEADPQAEMRMRQKANQIAHDAALKKRREQLRRSRRS